MAPSSPEPHPSSPGEAAGGAAATWFLAALGFLIAALCLASLTWDGSYYLLRTLHEGSPMVPHHRWLNRLILAPVLWAQPLADDPAALARLHGLLCAVAPLASLAACLAMLRGRFAPLRMWAVFGILLAPLPGQIVLVGEVTSALQVGWVGLAFVWCGCPWRWAPAAVLAGVAGWGLHPAAVPMSGLAAATAFALAMGSTGPERRRFGTWSALFALAAVGKALDAARLASDYERANLHGSAWLGESFSGLVLTPFAAILPALAAAALEYRSGWTGRPVSEAWRRGLWILALGLGLVYGLWPGGWAGALCYRKFGILAALPVATMAGVEAWRLHRGRALPERSAEAVVWPALLFAVTMTAMSLCWLELSNSLMRDVAATPGRVHRHEALTRRQRESALNHWSATSLSLLLQGWRPTKVHVFDSREQRGREGFAICPGNDFPWTDAGFRLSWVGELGLERESGIEKP